MTSIISDIDFSNIQFSNTFEQNKFPEPQHLKKTNSSKINANANKIKTSYSIFEDYINQIDNLKFTDKDFLNKLNEYYTFFNSSTHTKELDLNKAKETISSKLSLIHTQEECKDSFIVYADTSKNKSSSKYPNILLYNYIFLNDPSSTQFIINNIIRYNFSEHNYTNYSRLFFDIDFEQTENFNPQTNDKFNDLIKLFKLIRYCQEKYSLNAWGTIEYLPIFKDILASTQDLWPLKTDNIFWFELKNNNSSLKYKTVSGHIYLDGYANRMDIMYYMAYLKSKFDIHSEVFDTSIYKTTKQAFRMSYSPKIFNSSNTPPRWPSQALIDFVVKNPTLISELRMAPKITDKKIEIESYTLNSIPQDHLHLKSNLKSSILNENDKKSIFSYVSTGTGRGKKIMAIADIIKGGESAYRVSQILLPYKSFVLTEEEFEKEIKLLIPDLNNDEWDSISNEEWINTKLLKMIDYRQDLTNIIPLYTLKRNIYTKIEEFKTLIKLEEKKDTPDISTLDSYDNSIYSLKEIIERTDQYIDIYQYISFASHSFYDISLPENIIQHKKDERVLYNIYKLDDGQYIEAFPRGAIYKNQKAFKDHFKYSGETLDYIEKCLTVYHSVSQFNFYRSKYLYMSSDASVLLQNVHDLLKVLRQTFVHENDFKYYIGFLALKIRQNTTLNKGIISQPDGKSSGKDALKTFITDLISSFITVKKCTVEQFNNRLNGEYLKSDLVVFEEMPDNIKDIDLLVNNIKTYSSSKTVNAECKGVDAIEIDNNFDFIINSNHSLSKLFYNKQDCEALLKRFKVLTRKSLDMSDPFIKSTMDKFGWQNQTKSERAAAEYAFYIYLKENDEVNEYINVYKSSKNTLNEIEEIYSLTGVEDSAIDKVLTHEKVEDFIDRFKKEYANEKKRINKTKLADILKSIIPSFKNWTQKTIIHELETSGIFNLTSGKKLSYSSDDQIKTFYSYIYSFEEKKNLYPF